MGGAVVAGGTVVVRGTVVVGGIVVVVGATGTDDVVVASAEVVSTTEKANLPMIVC